MKHAHICRHLQRTALIRLLLTLCLFVVCSTGCSTETSNSASTCTESVGSADSADTANAVDTIDTADTNGVAETTPLDESTPMPVESESDTEESDTQAAEPETEPETEPSYDLLDSMTTWQNPVTVVTPTQPSTEDTALELWFDHLTEKRARYDAPNAEDLTHTTYTIQMAKNEMEGCHFYLYHPSEKKVLIEYTLFTHASCATVATELGVEF